MSVPVSGGVLALAVACLLAACGGDSSSNNEAPSAGLRVVSSAPEWVSGGDARVAVSGSSSLLGEAQLRLNGETVDIASTHDSVYNRDAKVEFTALEAGRYLVKLDTAVTEAGGQPFWYVLDASMTVVASPDTGTE